MRDTTEGVQRWEVPWKGDMALNRVLEVAKEVSSLTSDVRGRGNSNVKVYCMLVTRLRCLA